MYIKKTILFSLALIGVLFTSTLLMAKGEGVNEPKISVNCPQGVIPLFAPNDVLITFKKGKVSNRYFRRLLDKYLGKGEYKVYRYKFINAMHITSDSLTMYELQTIFFKSIFSNYIDAVFPNNIALSTQTSDPHYRDLWAIENRGQLIEGQKGTEDADMDVSEAWEKTKGSKKVVIAVLDSGVDYEHNDLNENMWNGEKNHGYDFAGDNDGNNDDNPMPDLPYEENAHYHGTHVAGTIGAIGDNESGLSGVAQKVSMMAVKVFRPNGYGYSSDILEGLEYIAKKVEEGVNIVAINASYGNAEGTQNDAMNRAIKKLGEKGVLFCVAAGNQGQNIDDNPIYPASYNAKNIITVAASDQNDKLATFSNYGKKSVDVAAPGTKILSTYPNNEYAYLDGTSMATPNVTGAIALLAAAYPSLSVRERKKMIIESVDLKDALRDKVSSAGRVNINNALAQKAEVSKPTPQSTATPKPNHAPYAKNDKVSTNYERAVTIDVLLNDSDKDGDTLTLKSFTIPANGRVKRRGNRLVYTPNSGFSGEDSFIYIISDGQEEAKAKVRIEVKKKIQLYHHDFMTSWW